MGTLNTFLLSKPVGAPIAGAHKASDYYRDRIAKTEEAISKKADEAVERVEDVIEEVEDAVESDSR